MHENTNVILKPTLLYRLRLLAGTLRHYGASATTKQLLKLGLIAATGRVHPDTVAIHRGGSRSHGGGRALRSVLDVAGTAILRGDVGPDHLQHVEM